MSDLQFYIRHQDNFLQKKFILIFKNNETRDFFQNALEGSRFEEVTSDMAQHAARIGINGKVIPYGYTMKLTDDEMKELSTMNWQRTAELVAEGNERLFQSLKEKGKGSIS